MLAGSGLGGCASTVPIFDVPYSPTPVGPMPDATSITTRIRCELAAIASGSELNQAVIDQENLIASVELSLTVTDDGALAPSSSYVDGSFLFGGGVKFDQSRAQNFTGNLTFTMASLRGLDRDPQCQSPPHTNLAGDLGLRTIWALAKSSGAGTDWTKKGSTGAFGGYITFTVDKALTATGPTWKLRHFTGPGPFLTASDKNIDKITIGFAKGPNAKAAAQATITSIKQNQQTDVLTQIVAAQRS